MDINERLKSFDDYKLIDIVKNYRQYKYDESIRDAAISILEARGTDLETLQLRGDLVNKTFDDAKQKYRSFESNSKVAFVLYGLMFISRIAISVARDNETLQLVFAVLFWLSAAGFIIYLVKSFINQAKYYDLVGKKESQLNPGLYFTVGLAVYIVMFFVFRKQMRDEMNEIR